MFSTVKIVLSALVFALQVAVVDAHTPEPVPEVELHRPLDVPDRIVLTWTDDPATSQAVTWRTAARVGYSSSSSGSAAFRGVCSISVVSLTSAPTVALYMCTLSVFFRLLWC